MWWSLSTITVSCVDTLQGKRCLKCIICCHAPWDWYMILHTSYRDDLKGVGSHGWCDYLRFGEDERSIALLLASKLDFQFSSSYSEPKDKVRVHAAATRGANLKGGDKSHQNIYSKFDVVHVINDFLVQWFYGLLDKLDWSTMYNSHLQYKMDSLRV